MQEWHSEAILNGRTAHEQLNILHAKHSKTRWHSQLTTKVQRMSSLHSCSPRCAQVRTAAYVLVLQRSKTIHFELNSIPSSFGVVVERMQFLTGNCRGYSSDSCAWPLIGSKIVFVSRQALMTSNYTRSDWLVLGDETSTECRIEPRSRLSSVCTADMFSILGRKRICVIAIIACLALAGAMAGLNNTSLLQQLSYVIVKSARNVV